MPLLSCLLCGKVLRFWVELICYVDTLGKPGMLSLLFP